MKALLWQGYGEVSLYNIENRDLVVSVIKQVAVDFNFSKSYLDDLKTMLIQVENGSANLIPAIRTVAEIVNDWNCGMDAYERFEIVEIEDKFE